MSNFMITCRPKSGGKLEPVIDPNQGKLIYAGVRDAKKRAEMCEAENNEFVYLVIHTLEEPTILGSTHKRLQPLHPQTRIELINFLEQWIVDHKMFRAGRMAESGWLFDAQKVIWNGDGRTVASMSDDSDVQRIVNLLLMTSTLEHGVAEATTWSAVLTLLKRYLQQNWDFLNQEGHDAGEYNGALQEASRITLLMSALMMHGTSPVPDAGMFPGRSQAKQATPTVVCLCGSTRFSEAFQQANLRETLAGNIVLTIGCDTHSDTELFDNKTLGEIATIKVKLDELHLRKIDMADEVLILNVGGYIGESTSRELAYAMSKGKAIRFLEEN